MRDPHRAKVLSSQQPAFVEPVEDVLPVLPAAAPEILSVLPATVKDLPSVLPATAERVATAPPADRASFPWRVCRRVARITIWLFGAVTVIGGLAFLAAIPLLQFLSLGYLLEAAGRIARTGRLRDGFIGVRQAALVGFIVGGTWLLLLPSRLISSLTQSAQLIDPDSSVTRNWQIGFTVLTVATVLIEFLMLHVVLSIWRGGKLSYFVQPLLHPCRYYVEVRDAVWDFVVSLRLLYYFWLGVRGFVGAMIWLVIPISLLALGSKALPLAGQLRPGAENQRAIDFLERGMPVLGFFVGLLGAILFIVVLLYVPFLQTRFAAENRLRAFFELRAVRADFCRAPWAFAGAFFITLLFAVPLYLLKIEMIPREVAWLPSLVFVVFIFPARLLTGWAYGRARRRATPRHWFFRWTGRLSMLPVAALYVLVVFFTQYAAWQGVWSLYEQHAFLLPVPFAGR